MAEYIDREELLKDIEKAIEKSGCVNHEHEIIECIRYISMVDVVPVAHGKWIYDESAVDWGIGGWICSKCFNRNNNIGVLPEENPLRWSGSKYCPNCGAKMDGGE